MNNDNRNIFEAGKIIGGILKLPAEDWRRLAKVADLTEEYRRHIRLIADLREKLEVPEKISS